MTDIEIWKASEARAWAEAVRGAARKLRKREAALEELTARYDGLKATSYDKAGSGDPGDDAMVAMIAELDAMRERCAEATLAWRDEVSAFQAALRRLDPVHDQLLTARYVRDLPWSDIARMMGRSESHVRGKLAYAALVELHGAMPPQMREVPKAVEDWEKR